LRQFTDVLSSSFALFEGEFSVVCGGDRRSTFRRWGLNPTWDRDVESVNPQD